MLKPFKALGPLHLTEDIVLGKPIPK